MEKVNKQQKFMNYQQFDVKQDFYLFNTEIFNGEEVNILKTTKALLIPIQTQKHSYSINTRYMFQEDFQNKPPILFMHGHGSTCTWATWIKLALIFHLQDQRNCILIDLPGFGKSTVDNKAKCVFHYYRSDVCDLIIKFLDALAIKKVQCVGFCGGAAHIYRALSEYPERFGQSHIFHNVVIGSVPKNLEEQLIQNKIKMWVSWCVDSDHEKHCVGYKYLDEKRKQKSKNIFLQDIKNEELPGFLTWSKKMGRNNSDYAMIFNVSEGYAKFAINFLNGQSTQYSAETIYKKQKSLEDEIIQKSRQDYEEKMMILQQEHIQLAQALQMSVEQMSNE